MRMGSMACGALAIGWCVASTATGVPFDDSTKVNLVFMPGVSITAVPSTGESQMLNKYQANQWWNPNSGSAPTPYMTVDLGKSYNVKMVRFRQYGGQETEEYKIWVGDVPANFNDGNYTIYASYTPGVSPTICETNLPPATLGRYVRIQYLRPTKPANWYNMGALNIYTTDPVELDPAYPISEWTANGALYQVVSGSWENSGRGLLTESKATDFDNGTTWLDDTRTYPINSSSGPATLKITLNDVYTITQSKMAFYVGGFGVWSVPGMKVELSRNDSTYTTVVDVAYSAGNWTDHPVYNFAPTVAKYVKITVPQKADNGGQSIMYRTDFFGSPALPKGSVVLIR